MPSILFVCTGNTCRSPMAAALFTARLIKTGEDLSQWKVESAGLNAEPGQPASPLAQQVMVERGLDLNKHRSQKTSSEMLIGYDKICCMEVGHLQALISTSPQWKEKVMLLSQSCGQVENISDPYGGSLEDYRRTALQIENFIQQGWMNLIEMKFIHHFPDLSISSG